MNRSDYNSCMSPYMTGKGLTKEERQKKICVGAKICSGKAETEEEAVKICESLPPKEPKEKKSRSKSGCSLNSEALVSCLIKKLPSLENIEDFEQELSKAVSECCNKKKSDEKTEEAQAKLAIAEKAGLV